MWESELGTTHQNDFETVTRHYVVDYLSVANRDLIATEDGSYVTRYVYDENSVRISAEFAYADGAQRGATNANGEYGENPQSDFAFERGKVWYRWSNLGSTLFAVNADGEVVAHMVYDSWGVPLTDTYPDTNFSGLENLNNYTGYTYDETLNLYFAQNRFYDADLHRFTQEDIVKDGNNWYVYCGNNPTLSVDPNGTKMRNIVELVREYGATITWKNGSSVIGSTKLQECAEDIYNAAHSQYRVSSVKLTATVKLNGASKTYNVVGNSLYGNVYVKAPIFGKEYEIVMDDLAFAHDWNKYYNQKLEPKIVLDDEYGKYIIDQTDYPFTKMRYGVTTMNGVACELIAIYNTMNKLGHYVPLSEIADYYEHNLGMWNSGKWGTEYWRIDDYFQNYLCIEIEEVNLLEIEKKLTDDNACILTFNNPNSVTIHTIMVIKEGDTFVAYNYGEGVERKGSISDLLHLNNKNRRFISAYIVSNI